VFNDVRQGAGLTGFISDAEERAGMPRANRARGEGLPGSRAQPEKAKRICHRDPTPADPLRHLLLCQRELLDQAVKRLRLFERTEIGTLNILDERQLQALDIRGFTNNHWNPGQACLSRSLKATMSRDEHIATRPGARIHSGDDKRLENSMETNALGELIH
jgi:hypothetical protein